MKTKNIKNILAIITISNLFFSCSETRTDWSSEESSRAHIEAFESFRPDPAYDNTVLEYKITNVNANVLSMEISVPVGYRMSPNYLSVFTESSPTAGSIEFAAKGNTGEIISSDRIAVSMGDGHDTRTYKIRVILPKGLYGAYSFRIRSYTYYTYGADYAEVNTYAFTTAIINHMYSESD